MFTVSEPEDTSEVLAQFKQWIAASPTRAGLSAMPDTTPLAGLVPGPTPPRRHGTLVLHRFAQSYRGLELVGAGEHVTLTLAPGHGAVSVSGALVDSRDTYDGWDAAITPAAAVAAAEELLAIEDDELETPPFTFGAPRLVAVAEVRTLAWEMAVAQGGHGRGTLLLRADSGAMLAFSPDAHYSPDDEVAIKIRARTFASDILLNHVPDQQVIADIDVAPVTGGPLLGSTYTPAACDDDPNALPACGQIRLGNREIVVLDANKQNFFDKMSHPRIGASPTGEFLATPPATGDDDSPLRDDAALQDFFFRLQATYSLIDGFHFGHWDRRNDNMSGFPAQKYRPRVVLVTNTDVKLTCGIPQPGCAKMYFPHFIDEITKQPIYDEHPEGDLPPHVWAKDDIHAEPLGSIFTTVDGFKSPDLVFHEFGHVVDLFTAPGMIGGTTTGSGCTEEMKVGDKCVASCVLDSTDEAQALAETVADMIDLFSVGQLYTTVEYGRCETISSGITSVSGPVHDAACVEVPGDIKSFLDQRPAEPGMVEIDGVWLPTGMCVLSPGYRQSGILQAWWEWTHARDCLPDAPFTCEGFADESEGARSGIEALLFAMSQTNSTYYRKLFTDMEVYIACTDGPARAAQFRGVFCHHGALDCGGLPPVCPATCGDGEAELTEACDGDDLRNQTCVDHGFVGGVLSCHDDCTYDISLCTDDVGTTAEPPTPTTPTTGADIPTTGADPTVTSTSETTTGEESVGEEAAEDGCGCHHGANPLAGLVSLVLLTRRRRRVDAVGSAGVS